MNNFFYGEQQSSQGGSLHTPDDRSQHSTGHRFAMMIILPEPPRGQRGLATWRSELRSSFWRFGEGGCNGTIAPSALRAQATGSARTLGKWWS